MRTPLSSTRKVQSLVLLVAGLGAAVAAWLIPASIHVVDWQDGTPSRVAFLPPPERLLALVALAVVAVLVVTRLPPSRVNAVSRVSAPLALLWLWTLPYLPWLSDRVPLLLVLAGPTRWLVLGVALMGCAVAAATERRAEALRGIPLPGHRTVFVVTLILLLAIGGYSKYQQGLGGDEPHYLVIAHSLLVDGDLQIENNHEARHYQPFWSGLLPPHFLQRGIDRVVYSIHAPGLPALLLPFYAVAGHWGAMVLVVLLASLAATSVFRLAERLTDRRIAWVTWLAVALTIPFAPQSWLIFPEMPAALVMAWVAAWLFGPLPARRAAWIWRGAAVGFLPWLHMKYSFLLVGATVCLLIRLWPRLSDAARFLAPMAVSGLLWFGSFYLMYGTPNPTVVYGYGAGAGLELSNIPRGVLGLLFDQEFGLLLYSPVYALAVVGGWMMVRRSDTRWPMVGLIVTAVGFILTIVPYYMWWGGWSVPARFLLPVLPIAAPMLAVAFARCRGAASRGVAGLLLLAGVASFAVIVAQPQRRLLFNERDGTGRLVEAIQGEMDLTSVLPSFIQPDWVSQMPQVGVWLVVGLIACAAGFVAGRRHVALGRAFWSGAVCLVVFVMAGSLVNGASRTRLDDERVVTTGRLGAIAAFDGDRLLAYSYSKRRPLTDAELFARASISLRPVGHRPQPDSRRRQIESGRVVGPYALPAGRYRVRVSVDPALTALGAQGEVWVAYHRGPGVLSRRSVTSSGPIEMTLDLPVNFDPLWIGASSEPLASAITQVEIDPVSVLPRTGHPSIANIRQVEVLADVPGQYAIHVDDNVFVERDGFWVRGGRSAALHVSPNGASQLRVTIRNGAARGPVTLEIDGTREVLELGSGETHEVSLALTGRELTVPLTIEPINGFRPSERNPESRDTRWLGCRVHLSLE